MPEAYHTVFANALRSGDAKGLARFLSDPSQIHRFAVYRNSVVRASIEALRAAYPAVNRLVGDNFFAPMAMAYWDICPARERTLTLYGESFPSFVATYKAASELVYLRDVARHDRAWLEAHHAADIGPLEPERIVGTAPDDLLELTPGLHVSVRLLESRWPSYEIWRGNRFDDEAPRLTLEINEWFSVVWRRHGEVCHRALSRSEHAFLMAVASGQTIAIAAEAAVRQEPEFDAASMFSFALSEGLFGA